MSCGGGRDTVSAIRQLAFNRAEVHREGVDAIAGEGQDETGTVQLGIGGCFWLVAVMRLIGHLLRLYVGQGKTAFVPTIHNRLSTLRFSFSSC